jgi:CRISPR-associated protein Cas6
MKIDDAPLASRVDLVFPVDGRSVPRDHRALLATAVGARLVALGREPGTGVLDLNLVAGSAPLALLSRRTRMVLRLAREHASEAEATLRGATLDLGGHRLVLGTPTRRELRPHRTLYAHFVASPDGGDEATFLVAIEAELRQIGAACRPVCGMRQVLRGQDGPLAGFSLMLDGLAPADARSVLEHGLGGHRRLGGGLFVPHRSAAAVGA